MTRASDWFVIMSKASVCLAVLLWGGLTPAALADPVHSNYQAGNGYGFSGTYAINNGCGFATNVEQAMAFTVPPGFDYYLNKIDLTLRMIQPACTDPVYVELWSDASGLPGAPLAFMTLSPPLALSSVPVFYTATPSGTTILVQNTTYWVVVWAPSPSVQVEWSINGVFARGPRAERPPSGAWTLVNNNAIQAVFRIVGTPVMAQPVKSSYSSYTAPAGGGPATLYLEVVCATLSNPFTMPVSVSLPPGQTPTDVCQLLASTINACGCPCWGASCPSVSPAPYGFHADCSGSVLRVTNSNPQVCSGAGGGAFVCADHADGVTEYNARKQLEGVSGAIAMEIRGVATGVAGDSGVSNNIDVIRTLRCGPDFPPQVSRARVTLAAGMETREVIQSLAEALVLQGDKRFVVEGSRITFLPPCEQGDYDIAFQVNDTGINYAFSPPFDYSFFDYVAQFTAVPTLPVWWWVALTLLLLLLLITLTIKLGRRRAARAS